MKTVHIFITSILLVVSHLGFTQAITSDKRSVEINELGFTVTSLEDLKTIDWDNVLDIFEDESDTAQISFYVELKDFDVKNQDNEKVHFSKVKYEVSGYKNQRKELGKFMKIITKRILKSYKS